MRAQMPGSWTILGGETVPDSISTLCLLIGRGGEGFLSQVGGLGSGLEKTAVAGGQGGRSRLMG